MTSIPLSSVVAFLRPRGALGVLEGAPFFYAHEAAAPHLRSVHLRELTQIGNVERVATVMLYLGDGEICPAAEGWAARVLALARGMAPIARAIEDDDRITLWSCGLDEYDYRWWWSEGETEPFEGVEFTLLPGQAPTTPAARLAAVLHYEMERAR